MAGKRFVKIVVMALSIAFVASSVMIFVSERVQGSVWTETSDTDFSNYSAINGLDILGTGSPAYMALKKDVYNWFNRLPPSNPGARYAFPMVWDALNGKAFLFGGLNATSVVLNDTWSYTYATNTWTRIQANAPPPARYYAGMAYDTTHNVAVLYGGYDKDSLPLDDTWEWDAATGVWTNTSSVTRPKRLTDTPMVFDSTQGKIILAAYGAISWETWQYDQPTHTWSRRMGATSVPSQRSGHKLAYYPDIQKTVLYGGSFALTSYAQTWEYDYASDKWVDWTGNTGGSDPGYRSGHGIVYRPNTNELVLWGGLQSGSYPADTWRYLASGSNRFWYSIPTPGTPPGRGDFGLAFNTVNTTVVIFGGKNAAIKFADTWSFEPGYRAQGSYQSKIFNGHYGNTQWQYLFWNQTPADVPAGGTIRFRIATSNSSNPSDPSWVFRGWDGTTSTYYTAPGTAIWAGASPRRYLMYSLQVLCAGCSNTPQVQDVSVQYNAPQVPPTVLSRGPETAGTTLYFPPIDTPIWINFSEPMDTAQVTVTLPPSSVTLTKTWTDPDTSMLYITHTENLNYCTAYHPTITQAVDQQGQSMAGLPYSWIFVTVCPEPVITSTYPSQGAFDIPLTAPIWVNFSKPMNTSSVSVNVTPPVTGLGYSWSNGDKTLQVTHNTDPFIEGTVYTVNVTGKDTNDKFLIPGSVPNPWTFQSRYTSVRVLSSTPSHQQLEVVLTSPVTIQFSHKMNTTSVNVVFVPAISMTKSWNSPTDDTVTLTHASPFVACTKYNVNVTGRDYAGNNLFGGYYAFWFFTSCGGSPYVIVTQPVDGSTDVALDQNVQIAFNEAMVTSSVTYTVQPNDWTWTATWNLGQVLTLEHVTPFQGCSKYFINVTGGHDVDESKPIVPGPVPNHFSFTTACTNPFVRSVVPPNGAVQVPVNTNIVITFSKTMNITSFVYRMTPDPLLIPSWNSPTNTVFTLSHGPLFQQCTVYNLTLILAEDPDHHLLIGKNSFNFTTFCGTNPHIMFTDPANGATNVALNKSILVRFDKAMDSGTVNYVITPGGIVYQKTWTPDFKNLTLEHVQTFNEATMYTVNMTGCDTDGYCLEAGPVPNPWQFTTLSVQPFITNTDPRDLAQDVILTKTIRVDFNKPMDPSSVTWTITPTGISYTPSWQNSDKTLLLFHPSLFNVCTNYNVTIAGSDPLGNHLRQGPASVPNPWAFRTTCLPGAPGGLIVHRVGNDIQLSWRAPVGGLAVGYHVYESQNRLAVLSGWNMIGNVSTTTFTHTGGNSDGLTHFYIVKAYSALWYEGPNSTMGVKLSRTFTFNPSGTNTQWFGLPYKTIYGKASDIATELTSTKINIVAKWDSDKQQSILYYYLNGKWRGKDFIIHPGDGLWLGVVSTFTWSINGTDPASALQFVFKPASPTHYFWMSLPYTTSYATASMISTELTAAKITEIGRYNPATNSFEKWFWDGNNWVGTDFPIMPGDGIYLVIRITFSWTPKLITPEVP